MEMQAARSAAFRRGLCSPTAAPPAPYRLRAALALGTVGLIGVVVAKDRMEKTEEEVKTANEAGKLSPEQEAERKQFEECVSLFGAAAAFRPAPSHCDGYVVVCIHAASTLNKQSS
jgi:hypothetical protein